MTKKALLITGQESETISVLARNLIHVGGISIFARQMKQMKAIGVEEMHVVTDWFAQDFEKEIQNSTARPENVFIHSTKDAPIRILENNSEGNRWFLIEEGVLLDDRIIHQVDQHPSPTVISFIGYNDFLEERTAAAIMLPLELHEGYFGSIAKLSSRTLAANVRKLDSLENLPNALKAISRASDCVIVSVTDIPLYIPEYSRNVDLIWFPIIRREDGKYGTDMLLNYTQKSVLDWPAHYIHKPIENFIIKFICKFPITPNHITIATGIFGLYIMYLFLDGHMLPALLGAYVFGILSGLDRKLAYIKMLQTKLGHFKNLINKVIEYGWYGAIAIYLSQSYELAPYITAAALILFHLADDIQTEFFRRMTAIPLSDAGNFDRKFKIFEGCRNTQMWALLPFAIYDQWFIGFSFICVYSIITFFVHQVRVVYHLKNMMIEQSDIFSKNFIKTKIL